MWRDPRDAVLDMSTACDEIIQFTQGVERGSFTQDTLRLRALERCLSILGEAAKRVNEDFRSAHPEVPWKDIAGMRDVLVHDYFGIDLALLEQVVFEEIPKLQEILGRLLVNAGWSSS